jgi:hypothetical protein
VEIRSGKASLRTRAVAAYTLSADGSEDFSNNWSREYDFAIDGKE